MPIAMLAPDSVLKRFLDAQDRLVFQAADLSLGTISSMVSKGAIDVNPPYQRRERWSVEKQSALIESFLLNVPVPPIYLAEDAFGRYSVVDGKQRITSIHRFMMNDLALTRLEQFTESEGLRYKDLPTDLQNALDVRPYLRVITLLKQSDPSLKFEVFTRLNRGGESMEAQELRNVAFRGPLNDLIFELAKTRFLAQQLKIKDSKSPAYQNMLDAELVLRFLTLHDTWRHFSGDYRFEMDHFMVRNRDAGEDRIARFRRQFETAIHSCEAIWGRAAFKRPAGATWRDQLLTGMYDAEMVAVCLITEEERAVAIEKSADIREATRTLFDDPDFDTAVRLGTNTPARIVYRIEGVASLLR
jgi:hypothetical protein